MEIKSLKFRDSDQQWGFDEIKFSNLTLLVGISGVGKTQILESLTLLKKVANGNSLSGLKWQISFSNEGKLFTWSGEFEAKGNSSFRREFPVIFRDDETEKEKQKPKIVSEELYLEGKLIASRDEENIEFNDNEMPKLSSNESILSIFKEEDLVRPAYDGFQKIILRDNTRSEDRGLGTFALSGASKYLNKYKSLEEIKESDVDTIMKLYLTAENQPGTFDIIKQNIIDVFPQVEDIKISPVDDENLPSLFKEAPLIHIKEKGVNNWIPQTRISSGMLRTFRHISEMYLLSEGTVVLIDEFENSLGVNCINVLTEDLVFENSKLQFIATSHHPYIINKIPYEYWKIVTRKGGQINVYDADKFDLGESHHERFMNLINLPEYKEGIKLQ